MLDQRPIAEWGEVTGNCQKCGKVLRISLPEGVAGLCRLACVDCGVQETGVNQNIYNAVANAPKAPG